MNCRVRCALPRSAWADMTYEGKPERAVNSFDNPVKGQCNVTFAPQTAAHIFFYSPAFLNLVREVAE